MTLTWVDGARPITIAILAMGGEGGGVLSDWIVELGHRMGYVAQNTSVAGVAQRTGTTVYYVELFPPQPAGPPPDGRAEPVLSVFPTPGEVDIVIASELMEAGRAIQRGFCTPDRTLLIASTNRVYSITERMAPGDGRVDSNALLEIVHQGSQRFIGADFMSFAVESNSVISAALFGALAASEGLPFPRHQFEETIRQSGKGVEASLTAFGLGFEAATKPAPQPEPEAERIPVSVTIGPRPVDPEKEEERRRTELAATDPTALVGPALEAQAKRVAKEFPAASRSMLLHGCVRTAVFQDTSYTDRYLDRVARMAALEPDPNGEARLTTEAARHIALWMCYQDTIQVALQKIRRDRLDRVRQEARAQPGQLLGVHEYLHPRTDEVADTLPTWLGRRVANSKTVRRWIDGVTRNGMIVNTTSIMGYTSLWVMARFRPLRPRSYRFAREQKAIDDWLNLAADTAATDPDLAREIIECQRVLKGYGETHAHGSESFAKLMAAAAEMAEKEDAAQSLARLRAAALADEDGAALDAALAELGAPLP